MRYPRQAKVQRSRTPVWYPNPLRAFPVHLVLDKSTDSSGRYCVRVFAFRVAGMHFQIDRSTLVLSMPPGHGASHAGNRYQIILASNAVAAGQPCQSISALSCTALSCAPSYAYHSRCIHLYMKTVGVKLATGSVALAALGLTNCRSPQPSQVKPKPREGQSTDGA